MAILTDNNGCRHRRGYPRRYSCRLPVRSHRPAGRGDRWCAEPFHAPGRAASRWRPCRSAATAATSSLPVKPAGASSPSGQTAQWSRSWYPACRTAATSASRAPASCRPDSAPAAPRISPTGSPRATGTRARTAILRLPGHELISAGVRAGDLLVATEASARTIVVRCASSCTARYIAAGPAITHAEGHIAFTSAGR